MENLQVGGGRVLETVPVLGVLEVTEGGMRSTTLKISLFVERFSGSRLPSRLR